MPATVSWELPLVTIDGERTTLGQWRDQVLLVVNVASRCGYTNQYAGLEALWRAHQNRGFAVLGFPCNQFGGQEPGTEEEIAGFCSLSYDVTFPLFTKVDVNGPAAHPLWEVLKDGAPGVLGTAAIKWNFTKFLVGRDGRVVSRHGSTTEPADLEDEIEVLLGEEPKGGS